MGTGLCHGRAANRIGADCLFPVCPPGPLVAGTSTPSRSASTSYGPLTPDIDCSGDGNLPRLAVQPTAQSNLYLVWYDDSSGSAQVYYRSSSDDGLTWAGTTNVSNDSGDSTGSAMTVDGNGKVYVLWINGGNLYYRHRNPSTGVWSNPETVATSQDVGAGGGRGQHGQGVSGVPEKLFRRGHHVQETLDERDVGCQRDQSLQQQRQLLRALYCRGRLRPKARYVV